MFKLINFLENQHFNSLREKMKAPISKSFMNAFNNQLLDEDEIRKLGTEGIDVTLREIKQLNDRTLEYKGQRVLVYIRDVHHYQDRTELNLSKFHVSFCPKLDEMTKNGRWARYVVANRDDGYFSIRINNGKSEYVKLNVCKFCLETLRWNGYSRSNLTHAEKDKHVTHFSISDFFKKFQKTLLSVIPTYTSDTAPINDYSSNFQDIAKKMKESSNYICSDCGKQYLHDKKNLHVHHKNGLKNDNSSLNLEVVCRECHANKPYHGHMK